MRLSSILAGELAAFETQQNGKGISEGAIQNFYAPIDGSLYSPYASAVALRYSLCSFRLSRNVRPPETLLRMTGKFLEWQLGQIAWIIATASAAGTDSAGMAYKAGDLMIELFDGSKYAMSNGFHVPAAESGTFKPYTRDQLARAHVNMKGLFVRGCPFSSYARQADHRILPGWVIAKPFLGWDTPLRQLNRDRTNYLPIHDNFYDSTDSYPACLISLLGEYMRWQNDKTFATFLQKWWSAMLSTIRAPALNVDPKTGLCYSAPFTSAEFSMDNLEVWRGYVEFAEISRRAERLGAKMHVSQTEDTPLATARHFTREAQILRSSILRYCLRQHSQLVLFTPGWNGEIHAALDEYPPAHRAQYDALAIGFEDQFIFDASHHEMIGTVLRIYFDRMSQHGLPEPDATSYPSIYRYIIAAQYIGQRGAPFTLDQMSDWARKLHSMCVDSSKRNYRCWWILESAGLIWLCNQLIAKGAD